MSTPVLLQRLSLANPIFNPITTDFAGYVKQQLGDLGTGTDGWDAVYNPIAAAIDGDIASLGDLDTLISAASFTLGAFGQVMFAALDGWLPGWLKEGQDLNNAVKVPQVSVGIPSIPSPPPPPTGVGKSGGVTTVVNGGDINDCAPDCGGGYWFWDASIGQCMNWLSGSASTVSLPPGTPGEWTCTGNGTIFGDMP